MKNLLTNLWRVVRPLAALVVALALAEVVVRVLGLGVPPRGPNNRLPLRRDVPASESPLLGDTLKPNASGRVLYPGHGGEPDRWVEYAISADGFRDRRFDLMKPRGALRIACLGDSVTYGTGVAAQHTWPKALERELARRLERPVEVMNCGVYAHNTSQQVAWLELAVLPFRPDLVLIASTVVDASGRNVEVPATPRDHGWEKAWIERLGLTSGVWAAGEEQSGAQRATMFLRRRSVLADLVANRLYGLLFGRIKARSYKLDWAPGSPGLALVRRSLVRAEALARAEDFRLVCAMYPTLTTLNEHYPFTAEHARLGELCAELDLPFVDLFPALAGRDAASLFAHAHDRHPNAQAHALVARYLADELERRELLP